MYKFVLVFCLALCSTNLFAQRNEIGRDWQIGVGMGLVGFGDSDVEFIGDKHLDQLPRLNVTKRLDKFFSIDAAVSFGSFDSSTKIIAQNLVPYFSFDVSARYRYYNDYEKLDPYIFIGASMIDSDPEKSTSPSLNVGTGATYWITKRFGINGQFMYKNALNQDSMRSHWQATGGIVFGINSNTNKNGSVRCYYDQHKAPKK